MFIGAKLGVKMDSHSLHTPPNRKRSLLGLLTFYILGVFSIIWLLFRSGTKPSRLAYPCQRSATACALNFLASFVPMLGSTILSRSRHLRVAQEERNPTNRTNLLRLLALTLITSLFFLLLPGNAFPTASSLTPIPNRSTAEDRLVDLPPLPDPNPHVAVITRDHMPDDVETAQMVTEAIVGVLGPEGLDNLVAPGNTVLIKPNLGCGYKTHETAGWQVVKPIVQAAWQAGARSVTIAEGEGCNYGMSIFELSGYTANITDVVYVNFNDIAANPTYNVHVAGGYWDEPIVIPQVYFDADVVITVSALKTHNEAGVTMGLKNAFGVPPVPAYSDGQSSRILLHSDYGIRKTIPQINLAKKPDLAVVDAILAGEGQGPWDADPVVMNTILAGRDLVALDAVGTAIMGIEPARIPYLAYARYKNLGVIDLDAIQIVGTPIADIQQDFALPVEAPYIYRKAAVIEKTDQAVSVDGLLDDWYSVDPIMLLDESVVISGTQNWSGPPDLSLAGRFMYHQDSISAIVRVWDDQKVTNLQSQAKPAQGDMLEVYLSLTDPWSRQQDPDYGASDFHLGVSYGADPEVWDIGRAAILPDAQAVLLDTVDGYIIELSIPFTSLNNFSPLENKQLGLDFSAIDIDTNQVGGTFMTWSGDVNLADDPRLMGVALLGPQRAPQEFLAPALYLPLIQSNR